MGKKQHDDSFYDPSKKAGNLLDYVLKEETTIEDIVASHQVPVTEDRKRRPLRHVKSKRTKTRILFVSTDATLLTPHTELRDKLIALNDVFDEIHIMVITYGSKDHPISEKIGDRVWLYSKTARRWWHTTQVAKDIAENQLQFKDGFRPDIIVGIEPFEAGYAALQLATDHQRPLQIHILQDFLNAEFARSRSHAYFWLHLAKYVLNHVSSVCVTSESMKERIKKTYPHLTEPLLLPRFYNIKSILEQVNEYAPKPAKLTPFKFIALFVGELNHDSTLFRTIDATRAMLRSPSIALVVIGNGPMKKDFMKRAEILGVKNQIIFEPPTVDVVSYMRAADILIATDVTPESEEVVIKAAAVGLPLLLAETELRNDIFTDDINAFICQKDDTIGFSQKLSKFINNNGTRTLFSREARTTIKDRLYEDPEVFKVAYRDAIESVLIEEAERPDVEEPVAEPVAKA